MSDTDLERELWAARNKRDEWRDRAVASGFSLFIAAFFIPTIGPFPSACAGLLFATAAFRVSVWSARIARLLGDKTR